jgi:hypothetical protein
MNVGWLLHYLQDVPLDTEIKLMIPGTEIKEGDTYADLTTVNYEDVEKHGTLYLEATEW